MINFFHNNEAIDHGNNFWMTAGPEGKSDSPSSHF